MSEMSHEDAVQALTDAASQEAATEQAVEATPPAPAVVPAPVEGAPENAPVAGEVQAPEAGNTEEAFVPFNPDDLPEELIPAWKQLQSSFTPRLQEAAEVKRQLEELGGFEAIQQSIELSRWMQDPANWPTVYEEVYQAMEAAGYEFEDGTTVPTATPGAPQFDVSDDPDLAPLAQALSQLQSRSDDQQQLIENFYAQEEERQQMARLEHQQMQRISQMQQTLASIRQANPNYTDNDVKAIIELAPFYNDDLAVAQQRYESIVSDRLDRYIQSKRPAGATSIQPPAGAGVTSHQQVERDDLRDVEDEVVDLMRQLQAAGEFDDEF